MSTLPPSSNVTDPGTDQGEAKTFFASIRTWLSEAFGTDSTPSAVLAALGGLAAAGGAMSGLLKFKNGAAVASATTVNLTAATGNTVSITGTTGISAWTLTAGQIMDVIFAGVLTLTHHATNNNLPGAANITTAAGDRARLYYDGATVYVLGYQKANGLPVAGVLGAGQTRQDLTASRAGGTTYTNSTGRPIIVNVRGTTTGIGSLVATVGGFAGATAVQTTTGVQIGVEFPVMAGESYKVDFSNVGTIQWLEIR